MNTKQFQYVLELAREGSFSRAADRLNISQPSLSQYIKKVETQTGTLLFDRTGSDVRITDAGQVYVETGKKILEMERQMERKLEDLSDFRIGSIVIGVSPHRCIHLMPEVSKRFKRLYPGIHLVIEERSGASLLGDAEHAGFDLCIATLPVHEKHFTYQLMQKEELLLAVNVDSELYRRLDQKAVRDGGRSCPAVDCRDLDGEEFVMLEERQLMQRQLRELCEKNGIRLKTAIECRSIETQFAMVRAGIGAALMPSGISMFCQTENVAFFSFIQSVPWRDVAVIYRKGQYLSRPIRDLIEILLHIDA